MTDNFALLNEARRPGIDPEMLKEKFLALSSQFHPDRVHNATAAERDEAGKRYAEINAAYNCLREPKERVRHLLELESGAKPADIQNVPQEVMEAFFEIGRLCKDADAFLTEKGTVKSPLLKVKWFESGQEWIERLNAARKKVEARRDELSGELKSMNAAWESRSNLPLNRLEEIYRLLGYLARWSQQLQEKIVQLTLD